MVSGGTYKYSTRDLLGTHLLVDSLVSIKPSTCRTTFSGSNWSGTLWSTACLGPRLCAGTNGPKMGLLDLFDADLEWKTGCMFNMFATFCYICELGDIFWNAVMKLWKRLNSLVYRIISILGASTPQWVCVLRPKGDTSKSWQTANLFCSALVTWFHSWSWASLTQTLVLSFSLVATSWIQSSATG